MVPVIAIVGRPNVGKSTLFNCLTKSRDALVANFPGVTRDRKYGEGEFENIRYIVIDTGGMGEKESKGIYQRMTDQSLHAILEANAILFVVDAKEGLTQSDEEIAKLLRHTSKPIFLVVNKSEGMDEEMALSDFFTIGFDKLHVIASAHNRGVKKMLHSVLTSFKTEQVEAEREDKSDSIKIAVMGRPNVGKSTVVNRILGEERVIVYDEPGTTRDSIFIPFQRHHQSYTLIDTAGVRRRTKIKAEIEKFSVVKTLQAVEVAHVVIAIFNAQEGISDQDLRLLDFVMEAGKALVVAINKWDGLTPDQRTQVKNEMDRRLEFVDFARKHFISALHGTGVGNLFLSIQEAYAASMQKISTSILTRILQEAVTKHPPPLVHGRRIKLRYAHAGGHNPPIVVIHGNQTEKLSVDYLRYLINFFRRRLKLMGTPIRIELKSSDNPYKGKKNILTPRQRAKKRRLLTYVKKK
jgi:GTP-binding protein